MTPPEEYGPSGGNKPWYSKSPGVWTLLAGGLGACSLVIGNVVSIRDAVVKLAWPPALSADVTIRDLRPIYAIVLKADSVYTKRDEIGIGIEAVASNKGAGDANNCWGEVTLPARVIDYTYKHALVGELIHKPFVLKSGVAQKLTFTFNVEQSVYEKKASFRVVCDGLVTDSIGFNLREPTGAELYDSIRKQ